jgi:hypothetical protein
MCEACEICDTAFEDCIEEEEEAEEQPAMPEWAKRACDAASDLLGISKSQHVFAQMVPADCLPTDDSGIYAAGEAVNNTRYMWSTIKLSEDIQPDTDGYETITHEMIHVAQAPAMQAMDRILDLIPKPLRKHALKLWYDGNEQATVMLGRALAPLVRERAEVQAADEAARHPTTKLPELHEAAPEA